MERAIELKELPYKEILRREYVDALNILKQYEKRLGDISKEDTILKELEGGFRIVLELIIENERRCSNEVTTTEGLASNLLFSINDRMSARSELKIFVMNNNKLSKIDSKMIDELNKLDRKLESGNNILQIEEELDSELEKYEISVEMGETIKKLKSANELFCAERELLIRSLNKDVREELGIKSELEQKKTELVWVYPKMLDSRDESTHTPPIVIEPDEQKETKKSSTTTTPYQETKQDTLDKNFLITPTKTAAQECDEELPGTPISDWLADCSTPESQERTPAYYIAPRPFLRAVVLDTAQGARLPLPAVEEEDVLRTPTQPRSHSAITSNTV